MKSYYRSFLFVLSILLTTSVVWSQTLPPDKTIKKILLYTGTFDPPHLGHFNLVKNASEVVAPDLTLIIPNVSSEHKPGVNEYVDRKKMAQLNFQELPNAYVGVTELEQAFVEGDMAKVIETLHQKYPEAMIYELMGDDSYERFVKATNNKKLEKVTAVVAVREAETEFKPEKNGTPVEVIEVERDGYSSTKARNQIKNGYPPEWIRLQVLNYIKKKKLYVPTQCDLLFLGA